jgi:hypothetical protein
MSRRPGPVGATATLDATAEAAVAAQVRCTLEAVFDAVADTRTDTTALLTRVAVQGRRPATVDLAALRPGLHLRLTRQELVSGAGFVAAPGLLNGGSRAPTVAYDRCCSTSIRRTPRTRTTRTGTGSPSPATRGSARSPGPMSTTSAPTSTA